MAPRAFRTSVYYRLFHGRHAEWKRLFEAAPLEFFPGGRMVDLKVGDVISGNLAFTGFYDLDFSVRLRQLARQGGLMVDVGANMGYFSLLWAGANPANRVIAFEAAPRNIATFRKNVEANSLGERVRLVPKAAGDRCGSIWFELGPEEQTGWGGIASGEGQNRIEVPLVRIADELADDEIAVLKIDVEGADTWVLRGAEPLLRAKKVGMIFFEQNPNRMARLGIGLDEAKSFLNAMGYDAYPTPGADEAWVAMPRK